MSLRLETERKYETIFILNPDLEEAVAQSTIEKIKGIIAQGNGELLKIEDWGKRKLAYEVKKQSKGHYLLIHFSGTPALLSELERNFRVMDAVIKFQSVRLDEKGVSSSAGTAPDDVPEEALEENV